ncbi:site-specific recombinase [Solidesulfovibrio magneticus RS-1]|uniref:Site-specific recombinase n=2 Tax=Solidesulfovibrio TaxID=2910984 RepID=C4XKJ5_SOLM1|nr:site-specific recombinase [Solidesulfovibrio magneticus RS-1]
MDMATKWLGTNFPGVRFREHPTRKHGVQKDKYFAIYYKVDGKRREESLGWASQGMSAAKASQVLAKLKEAARTGEGATSLAEKRKLAEAKREEERQQEEARARENITFADYCANDYLPLARVTKKPESIRKTEEHVKNWLGPVVGRLPLKNIRQMHMQKVLLAMANAGRSPRSIQYVFATFRAIWNHARNNGFVQVQSPTKGVALPKVNNERKRYLSRPEADALLAELATRSPQTHDLALLSLDTGMRFSEVTGLTWGCVDLDKGRIDILNAKGEKDRAIPMTARVKELFESMTPGASNELIFKSRVGGQIGKISKSFDLAVEKLGLNKDVDDPKQIFSFHCLRHTCASWLIEAGTDLYVVQKTLGHSTPVVTQRYSHVADASIANAFRAMEADTAKAQPGKKVISLGDR